MSVLITAASHAEAYKLDRILQLPDVIFADHTDMPAVAFSGRKFIRIPRGSSPSYAHILLDLALNAGIDRIFPLYAEEILPLAESRQLFDEYGISVIVPSVLWLKNRQPDYCKGTSQLVVLEKGEAIAGSLPSDLKISAEFLSGIFTLDPQDNFDFTLLAL